MSTNRRESRTWKAKHARILTAALDEFIGGGFEGASMDRIAARAGVSKVTIYNHFTNKDELYDAVLNVHLQGVEAADYGFADCGEDLERGLHGFCWRLLDVVMRPETIGVTRLLALEAFRRGDGRVARRPVFGLPQLAEFLSRHATDGRLTLPYGQELAARQLVGMLLENSFNPCFWGGDHAVERPVLQRLVDSSVRMFVDHYGVR